MIVVCGECGEGGEGGEDGKDGKDVVVYLHAVR